MKQKKVVRKINIKLLNGLKTPKMLDKKLNHMPKQIYLSSR